MSSTTADEWKGQELTSLPGAPMPAVPPHAYPGPSLCHGLATLCKGVLPTKQESLNPAVHYVYMERYQQKSV